MTGNLNSLKNFARGGQTYHAHRLEIARNLLNADNIPLEPLSSFLSEQFFKLRRDYWSAFAFSPRDWEICSRLRKSTNVVIEENLLDLVSEYIAANANSVNTLYRLNRKISASILASNEPSEEITFDGIDRLEVQSLFAMKVECALHYTSADKLREQLMKLFSNGWCRNRLLYPLVYYSVNQTPSSGLDGFLAYVVTGKEHDAERLALKLLLSDEGARSESLAFKAYVGMMGHPYDACEVVLDHIEYQLAKPAALSPRFIDFLQKVSRLLPGTRAERLGQLNSQPIPFVRGHGNTSGLLQWFDLTEEEANSIQAFCQIEQPSAKVSPHSLRPLSILQNMRGAQYPIPDEFKQIVTARFVYGFTDAGRILGALLRAIYMVDRTERDLESRDVLRLVSFLGFVNPFVASAPCSLNALRGLEIRENTAPLDIQLIEQRTETAFLAARPFDDRTWINDLQWRLHKLERSGKVSKWLEVVRAEARLKPSFLTGINWQWVEEMIEATRLDSFKSFAGAYLLLLMEFEAPSSDAIRLRLTLEPFIRGQDFKTVVDMLIKEFDSVAPALVRRLLTPQNLLALGLASNFISALDLRIQALEACIKAYSFGQLLTEEMYEGEIKALTSELLLHNVNTGKFEIPWDTFRKDAIEKQQDLYATFTTLKPRPGEDNQLLAMTETPYTFPTGRRQIYRYRFYQAPLFSFLIALIEDFMQHPAFGIEVILSGRFRHNHLLNEVWAAIFDVTRASIPSVAANVQKTLSTAYRDATERLIERWCSRYLHTKRPDKPDGLFDVVPDQKALDGMLDEAEESTDILALTNIVVDWLTQRLGEQIQHARSKFAQGVTDSVQEEFSKVRERQLATALYREQDVYRVHSAVQDAVTRRIDELQSWFDGINGPMAGPISMCDLGVATESLFEGVYEHKTLAVRMGDGANHLCFAPSEVKIAFDMLREVLRNALRYGRGPKVNLRIRQVGVDDQCAYIFSNLVDVEAAKEPTTVLVSGNRYRERNESLFREGNSGLPKIAASAATLMGDAVTIQSIRRRGCHHLVVPLRRKPLA